MKACLMRVQMLPKLMVKKGVITKEEAASKAQNKDNFKYRVGRWNAIKP